MEGMNKEHAEMLKKAAQADVLATEIMQGKMAVRFFFRSQPQSI